ncbi:MAG: sensor histidine kinase [Phycisphaerales bacterium JB039]
MKHHGDTPPGPGRGPSKIDPPRQPPGPTASPVVADRFTTLVHELNNLLDGSLRSLSQARQTLDADFSATESEALEGVRRRVETVYGSLQRMCELVTGAMAGAASAGAGVAGDPLSLSAAAEHAVRVVRPVAGERRVTLEMRESDLADDVLAGPVYTLLLNGLLNATESVARSGRPGKVELSIDVQKQPDGRPATITIEITDDGEGLPAGVKAETLFEPGVTSKPGGFGLGLALCRQVATDLNGQVTLSPKSAAGQPGATLRITYLAPRNRGADAIG